MSEFATGPWIGTPYLKGGRTREGCDCWGLAMLIHQEHLGQELPGFVVPVEAEEDAVTAMFEKALADALSGSPETLPYWEMIEKGQEQPFDIAVIWRPYKGQDEAIRWGPVHCGVVTTPGNLIHCDESTDAIEVPFFHTSLMARSIQVYRYHA